MPIIIAHPLRLREETVSGAELFRLKFADYHQKI